jgi:F-box and WD-40 domain protein MET30
MASMPTDYMALRQSIEISEGRRGKRSSRHLLNIEMPPEQRRQLEEHARATEAGIPPSHDNCDADHDGDDSTIAISSTSKLAGQSVAPFLARHIPEQYAPLGPTPQLKSNQEKDPNTKYCYRHRPDSKCRRTADEPTMENLQRVCFPLHREIIC